MNIKEIQIELYGIIRSMNNFLYFDEPCKIEIIPELFFSSKMHIQRKLFNIANNILFNQFSTREYLFYLIARNTYEEYESLLDESSLIQMEDFNKRFLDKRSIESELNMIDKIVEDTNSSLHKLFLVNQLRTSFMYELVEDRTISPLTYAIKSKEVQNSRLVGFSPRTNEYEFFHEKIVKSLLEVQKYFGTFY